jgi:two-component SAPR family response regulator
MIGHTKEKTTKNYYNVNIPEVLEGTRKDLLNENQIDIIFLDIHLPVLDGLSFLKTLKQPPQIIFTTAYKEHTVEAFDLTACDYLVKPFSLERFIIAVDKAVHHLNAVSNINKPNAQTSSDHFFIKAEGKIYKIM